MGPGEQSEIFIGSVSVTKLKYESELSQWNPGCKSVCGVEHFVVCLLCFGWVTRARLSCLKLVEQLMKT